MRTGCKQTGIKSPTVILTEEVYKYLGEEGTNDESFVCTSLKNFYATRIWHDLFQTCSIPEIDLPINNNQRYVLEYVGQFHNNHFMVFYFFHHQFDKR